MKSEDKKSVLSPTRSGIRENDRTLVSVVIPSYNHARFVQDCIRSVIAQDYANIELIIIDDGSSDSSVEKIRALVPACEERFSRFTFRSRANRGLSATLNEAIKWCRGQYFSAIGSDDLMLPQKTSVLLGHIEDEADLAGVFCGSYLINSAGDRYGVSQPSTGIYEFDDLILRRHNVFTPTQLLRLECLKSVGGYREELYIEDFYMWLALTEKGHKLRVVDQVLVEYRDHEASNSKNPLRMYEERVKVLKYFSAHHLYNEALAANCLATSHFIAANSRITAAQFLIGSVGHYRKIVLTAWFAKCCIRILVPGSLVFRIRSAPK